VESSFSSVGMSPTDKDPAVWRNTRHICTTQLKISGNGSDSKKSGLHTRRNEVHEGHGRYYGMSRRVACWIAISVSDHLAAHVLAVEEQTKTNSVAISQHRTLPTEDRRGRLLRLDGVAWSVPRTPTAVKLGFLDQSRYFFFQVAPQLFSQG
jgi:hypothetical protein